MGRVLAIDFGTTRVGAAISDPQAAIASPLEVYERRNDALDAGHYRELTREHDVTKVVIGLPVHNSGREGQLARLAREWGRWLASITGLPVAFLDERFTSVEADNLMIESGLKRRKRNALRDKLAAQILLQGYLDEGCPDTAVPQQPLADSQEQAR
jgi:putative Holliday junction resolvase